MLRKQYGTLLAFETAAGLPAKTVKDVLRGRPIARTERAIAEALEIPLHVLFPRRYPSTKADTSNASERVHRQKAGEA